MCVEGTAEQQNKAKLNIRHVGWVEGHGSMCIGKKAGAWRNATGSPVVAAMHSQKASKGRHARSVIRVPQNGNGVSR